MKRKIYTRFCHRNPTGPELPVMLTNETPYQLETRHALEPLDVKSYLLDCPTNAGL